MKSLIKKFAGNSRGNVGILLALSAVPLVGVAGLAVDFYTQDVARVKMQAAVDAAILAGTASGEEKKNKVTKLIRQFANANGISDRLASNANIDVEIDDEGVISVRATGKIRTTLSRVMGIDTLPVEVSSQARMGLAGAEVAMVLDTTGSMDGAKITNLKLAATDFLATVLTPNQLKHDSVKVSIVPYAAYVNIGPQNANASWLKMPTHPPCPVGNPGCHSSLPSPTWDGCVGSREAPLNSQDGSLSTKIPALSTNSDYSSPTYAQCPAPITPLTSDESKLKGEVASLFAAGNTYIPGGLIWGQRTLSPQLPFTEGSANSSTSNKVIKKHLVLMTDGENTVYKQPGSAYHPVGGKAQSDVLTLEVCTNIKAANITVHTVAFEVSDAATKAMLENCASSPQHYYDAGNAALLLSSFEAIAEKIAKIHLSR
jgi:Flp pilus assembly protein TadG